MSNAGFNEAQFEEEMSVAVEEAYAEGYANGFTQRGIGPWELEEDWEVSDSKKKLELTDE
jgi:hypothetical protein